VIPNNTLLEKFADYPLAMWDVYGRERHPEYVSFGEWVGETYDQRRRRAAYVRDYVFSFIKGGRMPDTRITLIDEDIPDLDQFMAENVDEMVAEMDYPGEHYLSKVNALTGGHPQNAVLIDLKGKVTVIQGWENPTQLDEALSNIFGVEPTPGIF